MKHLTADQIQQLTQILVDMKKNIEGFIESNNSDLSLVKGQEIEEVEIIENCSWFKEKNTFLLSKINNALEAINNQTYGICEETGDHISFNRLKILPYTTLSIEGQRIRESLAA